MRRVLSNHDEVAHVWAQRCQSYGESGNMFFDGDVIYSYGRHFPIASFTETPAGSTVVLFTTDTYSVSTAKHIGITSYACNHYTRFNVPNVLAKVYMDHKENYLSYCGRLNLLLVKAANARTKTGMYMGCHADLLKESIKYHETFKLRCVKYETPALDDIKDQIKKQEIAAKRKEERNAKRREQQRRKYERDMKWVVETVLPLWRDGVKSVIYPFKGTSAGTTLKTSNCVATLPKTCLRVRMSNGAAMIETSRNVKLVAKTGGKVLKYVERVVKLSRTCKKIAKGTSRRLSIGDYYTLRHVDCTGQVEIGCHTLPHEEIEYVAQKLSI